MEVDVFLMSGDFLACVTALRMSFLMSLSNVMLANATAKLAWVIVQILWPSAAASWMAFTALMPCAGFSGVEKSCSGTRCSMADSLAPDARL